jgi:hypothetical protein
MPASHFDVKPVTGRPKFIVRHSTYITKSKSSCTVASKKFWSSMAFQNLVRLSQIQNFSLPNYADVNKMSKKLIN